MSSQNQAASLISSVDSPARRKRGRPRKDESIQGDNTPVTPSIPTTPASDILKKNKQSIGTSDPASDEMVGQMVSGVIEGSFDAGYLLNVKVGDTNTQLRGVVFLPGRYTPITAANDVAPHAKMYKRTEISFPPQNPQGHVNAWSPSLGKSEKPFEHKSEAPNLPDQGLHTGLLSGAIAATVGQSASIAIPPASNLPINDTSLPLGQKVLQEQILDSGLPSDKTVGQDRSLQGFEAFKLMKGPNTNTETPKASESVLATFTATLPPIDTVNLKAQVENPPMSSDLKPQELFHDAMKSFDLGNNQTPRVSGTEPQTMPSCEQPTGVNVFGKLTSSRQDIDISQDTQLELAKKIMSGAGTSHMDGLPASDASATSIPVPCSASMTSLPVMIFGAETIPPADPKSTAEESILPRMFGTGGSNSSLMATNSSSVESNAKDFIPPA